MKDYAGAQAPTRLEQFWPPAPDWLIERMLDRMARERLTARQALRAEVAGWSDEQLVAVWFGSLGPDEVTS